MSAKNQSLLRELKYTSIVGNKDNLSIDANQESLMQAESANLEFVNKMQTQLNNDELFNVRASISELKNVLISKIAGDSYFIPEAQLDTFTLHNTKAIKELKPTRKEKKARKQLYKQKLEVLQDLERKENPTPEEVHAIEKELLILEGYNDRQDIHGNLLSLVDAKYQFLKAKSLSPENKKIQNIKLATFYDQHTDLRDIYTQNQNILSNRELIKQADQKLYEKLYFEYATMVNTYNATNWGDENFKRINIELKNSTVRGRINELLKLKASFKKNYSAISHAREDFKELISLLPNSFLPNTKDKIDNLRNVLNEFNSNLINNKNLSESLEFIELRKCIKNHNLNDITDFNGFFKYLQEIDDIGATINTTGSNGGYINNIIETLKNNYPKSQTLPNWRNDIEPVVIPPLDIVKTSSNKEPSIDLEPEQQNTILQLESEQQNRAIFYDMIYSTKDILGRKLSEESAVERIVLGINDFKVAIKKSRHFTDKLSVLEYLSKAQTDNLHTYNDCYDYITKFDSESFDISNVPLEGSTSYKTLMLYLKSHL